MGGDQYVFLWHQRCQNYLHDEQRVSHRLWLMVGLLIRNPQRLTNNVGTVLPSSIPITQKRWDACFFDWCLAALKFIFWWMNTTMKGSHLSGYDFIKLHFAELVYLFQLSC